MDELAPSTYSVHIAKTLHSKRIQPTELLLEQQRVALLFPQRAFRAPSWSLDDIRRGVVDDDGYLADSRRLILGCCRCCLGNGAIATGPRLGLSLGLRSRELGSIRQDSRLELHAFAAPPNLSDLLVLMLLRRLIRGQYGGRILWRAAAALGSRRYRSIFGVEDGFGRGGNGDGSSS